jgi:D-alanine-D-alanine ligase
MKRSINNAADFGKVAVLMGGTSAEREISLKSGTQVLAGLRACGIDAHAIDTANDLGLLTDGGFDRAFNILHGRNGEDGVMQGFLQLHQIPSTGSGVLASALAMDKLRTKQIWQSCKIPTPAFVKIDHKYNINKIVEELEFPMMIKPVHEGSSIGMSCVNTIDELQTAIDLALRYDDEVMAEAWVKGDEYTVAILQQEVLQPIKLQTPNTFYDFNAKYQADTTKYLCPCGLDKSALEQLQEIALKAFSVIGATGWGRVDVMRDASGQFLPIEINTLPGMTDHSLVPMAAKAQGISFEELVWLILETSFTDLTRNEDE